MQLAEHEWEMVKTEHDRAVELGKAYERGWNAALAQQEPVAYLHNETELLRLARRANSGDFEPSHWRPLYTAPPKKEWVGLTAPEVQECYDLNPARFASRIEAKLKEKNHG